MMFLISLKKETLVSRLYIELILIVTYKDLKGKPESQFVSHKGIKGKL